MANKIRKEKCHDHADDRDISEYYFWVTDTRTNKRKKTPIDIYRCKQCEEDLDREIDRERRMRENEKKQREEADRQYWVKRKPKQLERERNIKNLFLKKFYN